MAQIRFPEDLDGYTDPWIVFTTHRPRYSRKNRSTGNVQSEGSGESVSLYFPTGLSFNDNLNYESYQPGSAGLVYNYVFGDGSDTENITQEDVIGQVKRGALRGVGDAISGGAVSRDQGRVTNPREFMMFSTPNIREFSFSFTFVPQSKKEADSVPRIIKFFRKAAYPEEDKAEYIFPDAFNIAYKQASDGLVKIPEVVCTSINVTYNPNSISFFKNNGMPVETTLELSFSELRPINKTLVEEGY